MDKNEMRQMLQNALDSVDEAKNTLEELKEEFEDEEKEESSDLKCPMNVFYMSLADVDKLVYGKFSALVFHPGDVIVSGKFRFRVIDVGNMQSINARPDEKHVLLRIEQFITDGTPFDNDGCNEWEKSSMRKYLNGEFLEMLSEEDRSAVKYVELHTGRKDAVSTDRVFLLSAKRERPFPSLRAKTLRTAAYIPMATVMPVGTSLAPLTLGMPPVCVMSILTVLCTTIMPTMVTALSRLAC